MTNRTANFIRAILQGMTGAGLFRRLRYPGQPDQLLGTETAEEVLLDPMYQEMRRRVVKPRQDQVEELDLAGYYARLYRTGTHEHTHESTCTAH